MKKLYKKASATRGEYLVFDCPYCQKTNYLNIEDDQFEGQVPDEGRLIQCDKCSEYVLIVNY